MRITALRGPLAPGYSPIDRRLSRSALPFGARLNALNCREETSPRERCRGASTIGGAGMLAGLFAHRAPEGAKEGKGE